MALALLPPSPLAVTEEPEEPSPRSRQRMQESTPAAQAELQLSVRREAEREEAARRPRVLLTPLAVAGRRPLTQKRLLSAYDEAEERAPAGKRLCPQDPLDPASEPGSAPANGLNGSWEAESDGSEEEEEEEPSDGHSQLSAYERKRLKNITENAKFFASLQLHESAARLHRLATKRQSPATKRAKPKKAEEEPVRRRSMRLQRVEPSGIAMPEVSTQPSAEEYPQVPAGPLPMLPEDQVGDSKLTEDLLAVWMSISEVEANEAEKHTPDMERYQENLNRMVLSEENIRKVVKNRVCSMAIHPSESIIFLAAGDRNGQIGLWNVDCRSEEGAHSFTVHNDSVNCMHFSPGNPAQLLSLSTDTLRCADVTRALFDEIYRGEQMSSFDFLGDGGSAAVVGQWTGDILVVDRRTPGASPELSADIGFTRTRTVHVHPVHKHYFMAAGSVDVAVYDVRYLKTSKNKPVSSLQGHTKSVASAYFSPVTGHRVVTVCADDKLRVYDTTSLSSTVAALRTLKHNNNTGRWLTRFRAIWDPKQEDCFVVGSMVQPRQIEVFQDTGKLLHAFCNPDCLASVCSINVLHPSKNILVGGNSSGRLHVFKEETIGLRS
ncbi:WD repeat-containing protein 76 [Dryobates pubescens]|uniref:WD repeat-containing protein 76 n=1 Tax=Dryobates pubescens TaxID=118200 RepID=UPI0023BA15DA|nr:WD repeat-containing protein 76 [Dryobates pubescens]